MSASVSSLYEHLYIDRNGKRIDLSGKTILFRYYESIFSPIVTANMVIVDTGSSPVPTDSSQDIQQRSGSIVNSLPITGNETLEFKIKSKSGTLDFQRDPLIVNGAPIVAQESNREAYTIALTSRLTSLNERVNIFKTYSGKISDSVTRILTEELKIPRNKIFIDETRFHYDFNGASQHPFKVLVTLASKSVPSDSSDPGYFLFETSAGMNFRSISGLISSKPKATYVKNSIVRSTEDNDFKIISMKPFKNQNTINALRSGIYCSRNIFFDPRTFEYTEKIIKLSEQQLEKYLGKKVDVPNEFDDYTRTHFHILDVANLSPKVGTNINNDPKEWQAKATMKYNLLFTQGINITVPCNLNLNAGDVVECLFEKVTTENRNLGAYDEHQSGKYLIAHLCHSFDPQRSFTSLTLVRDTYGLIVK